MFKKSNSTKVIVASQNISGFSEVVEKLKKWTIVNGLSRSTIENYSRKLADLSLFFNKLPEQISEDELRDYLAKLILKSKGDSRSEFKHTVYSMRLYFKMIGQPMNVALPKMKNVKKLPMVLSKDEFRLLLNLTKNFKHRLILMFIYSCGLRMSELINLKWCDVDVSRMMIHIKQSKGKKDRYVPLAGCLLPSLAQQRISGNLNKNVFSGGGIYPKMSQTGIRFLLKEAVKRSGIIKEGICVHTLRHSYATHLLEDGLDIISIKELLGHTRIESTLVYLQIGHYSKRNKMSPLDSLLGPITEEEKCLHRDKITKLIRNSNIVQESIEGQLNLF